MVVTAFFSLAIIHFAQELVMYRAPTRPSHLRKTPSIWWIKQLVACGVSSLQPHSIERQFSTELLTKADLRSHNDWQVSQTYPEYHEIPC